MPNDLLIKPIELEYILSVFDGKYTSDGVLLIHTATLFVPRLIHMNFFPRDAFPSMFHFTTKEIAIACRLMLLDKYGMLFHLMLKEWGIKSYENINQILSSMDYLGPSGEMARNTKQIEIDNKFLSSIPLLDDNPFDEIEVASNILVASSNTELIIKPFEIPDEPKPEKSKKILDFFLNILNKFFKSNEKEDNE